LVTGDDGHKFKDMRMRNLRIGRKEGHGKSDGDEA